MSIYVMARKAKMNKKRKEYIAVNPFYLNMTNTGRNFTKCNENTEKIAYFTVVRKLLTPVCRQFIW